jgi:hypothetical protein
MYNPITHFNIPPLNSVFLDRLDAQFNSLFDHSNNNWQWRDYPERAAQEEQHLKQVFDQDPARIDHLNNLELSYQTIIKKHLIKYIPECENANVGLMVVHAGEMFYPHRDLERFATLWYLTSNSNAVTKFYNTNLDNTELLYDNNYLETGGYYTDDLELHSAYQLQKNIWYGFNGKKVHSVENVTEPRKIIKVDLSAVFGNYDTFVSKYQHLIID